jgi:hypothetical protein
MVLNSEIQILTKIKKARRGSLFFTKDFSDFGSPNTLRKALERLVKSGEIDRVAAVFKKVAAKNVAAIGEISRLAIQALKTIGKENITDEEIRYIQNVLQNEKTTHLEYDIRLAPTWIKEIMKPVVRCNLSQNLVEIHKIH